MLCAGYASGVPMRRGLICLLLVVWPGVSFAAEPLTMLLIHILRQQVLNSVQSALEEAEKERARAAAIPRSQYDIDDQKLRALIDEGFVHLTAAQRNEVYAAARRTLADPQNAAIRNHLVQELAVKAAAVREAHEQLSNLPPARKRAIVAEARGEYERLPLEERQQMLQVLQAGIVPLPRELNDMILVEFSRVPQAPAEPRKE